MKIKLISWYKQEYFHSKRQKTKVIFCLVLKIRFEKNNAPVALKTLILKGN